MAAGYTHGRRTVVLCSWIPLKGKAKLSNIKSAVTGHKVEVLFTVLCHLGQCVSKEVRKLESEEVLCSHDPLQVQMCLANHLCDTMV